MSATRETDVLIIGGGPIGLTASLLLSQLGVSSILVDRRPTTSGHPRSRLLDRRSLEILRQLGIEEEIRATGLPPDWTESIRFFESLDGRELACIPSPSFHGVPRETSPSWPVMTTQDEVERILYAHARGQERADVRFANEAISFSQDEAGCRVRVRSTEDGVEEEITARYVVAADGARSPTRRWIERPLGGDPIAVFNQDVLFHADLSKWVGERKGGLLFIAHATGAAVFQPLDGKARWRCQISNLDPAKPPTDEFCRNWIRSAAGTEEAFPIEIESIRPWQFEAGVAASFQRGRVFLAGDAAHVLIPTGGLGNNTGFAGIHNLAWKLAFVVRGHAPPSLLESYDAEHGAIASRRVAASLDTAARAAGIFAAHGQGGDVEPAARRAAQYGNYEGLILGFEYASSLCIPDAAPPPKLDNEILDFVPVVRGGRRAPHAWLDAAADRAVFDEFGTEYVALVREGPECDGWRREVAARARTGFPIRTASLPTEGAYEKESAVLVRPDGVIAAHDSGAQPAEVLAAVLP